MNNIEDIYSLSPMQQGMLFHSLLSPESGVYSEQLSCSIVGDLNITFFKKAWEFVIQRHSILRSAFIWEDLEEPVQVVHKSVELPFEYLDWRGVSLDRIEKDFQTLLESSVKKGFDLLEPPLMHLIVVQTENYVHRFIWNHHHLLFDGWSTQIVLREVFRSYETFMDGRSPDFKLNLPYREYIAWLRKQDEKEAENYWRKKLTGFVSPTVFNLDKFSRNNDDLRDGYSIEKESLSENLSVSINEFCKEHKITHNTFMQGVWALLLHVYSGEDDIVFGSTVSGRPADLPGVESMVGLFINTLPVRVRFDPQKTIIDWLRDLQLQQAELRKYDYTSLVKIHGLSDVPRTLLLFESIVVFENYPVSDAMGSGSERFKISDVSAFSRTNFPLTLVVSPGNKLLVELAYDKSRFEYNFIIRIFRHINSLASKFISSPHGTLSALDILTPEEKRKIIKNWNDTKEDFPDHVCIHEKFERVAEKYPENIALTAGNENLTYRQLNAKANQLAHYLNKIGIGPENIVAVCMGRSFEMLVAVLGILKSGAAYLPLDPSYPKERLSYMIKDSNSCAILTHQAVKNSLPRVRPRTIWLDADREMIANNSSENPRNPVLPENLAYVIYTSGSTGKPKGTLIQHRSVLNLIQSMSRDFKVDPESRILQFASFGFDASVAEFFLALLTGAQLQLIAKDDSIFPEKVIGQIQRKHTSHVIMPPSFLTLLENRNLSSLKTVVSGGEACNWNIAERWRKDHLFFNGYGPTEATVGTLWFKAVEMENKTSTVPIGRPIENTEIYILDKYFHPVPVGVPGELHLGGAGLGRGYLNRPALTAEKFIPNPFSDEPGSRIYRTGDLVRYLPDGNVEFLGRIDQQVKIRGFRIELGEIRAVMNQFSAVNDSIAIAKNNETDDDTLVAYVIPERSKEIAVEELRGFLRKNLPDYMIPAAFIFLESFPLTANGKIDISALPDPVQLEEGGIFTGRTPTEQILENIWGDVLKQKRIDVDANFFELGGHSLLVTQVISRIREAFRIDIPLNSLFDAPTVASLARIIDQMATETAAVNIPELVRVSRENPLPLSFSQQRLWFLDRLKPDNPTYNIPSAIRFKGKLDIAALKKSIEDLVKRHEILRTCFGESDGQPVQIISENYKVELPINDLSEIHAAVQEDKAREIAKNEALKPFDLKNGPLFRVALLRLTAEDHIVLFTMHHTVSDGWSVGVLIHEISVSYDAVLNNSAAELPELKIQYADYAAWQRKLLSGPVYDNQLAYWKNQLDGIPPVLELPFDRPRPSTQSSRGANRSILLTGELTDKLRELSRRESVTLFMTVLAAFQSLLQRLSGQNDVVVGTPIAGRTHLALENLIGFFVNTLALRANFSESPTFRELLRQVRDVTLGAYRHQDLPFEKLVEELHPVRDMSHQPIFQVMLVFQNLPMQAFGISDLSVEPFLFETGTAAFDLSLIMMETEDGLISNFEYNADLFDESTIERMLEHFELLLQNIVADPDRKVAEIPILTDSEKEKLFVDWNCTETEYPSDRCVHEWFESIAAEQPEAIAAIFRKDEYTPAEKVSYGRLNAHANNLAARLAGLGIGPEKLVGICMERSFEMVYAILAVLKASGAFLPIDPAYPAERIEYMLNDSGAQILLTQSNLTGHLPASSVQVLCLDEELDEIQNEEGRNPHIPVTPDNLAYVIYTSGSTGKPKGTMLRHRGMCNLATAQIRAFGVGPGSRIFQFSSLSFDASVWELVMAFLSGAALCLTSRETVASGHSLAKVMKEQKVNVITLPPSVLAVLPEEELPDLKVLITAGEAVSNELVRKWSAGRKFFNAYGPTETTVCASMYLCEKEYPKGPPIGQPISNFKLYILDSHFQQVPIGVAGELCVDGVGLARGYLNRPGLTAEKFIPNIFSREKGARLYRTGDLARFLPDGNVEFLGRIDTQVKIRGFRIELGEIEAVLNQVHDVRDAAVIARNDNSGEDRLVAYFVPGDSQEINIAELRKYMRGKLPDYMIPSAFVKLDKIPLTPNGKLDHKVLPFPEFSRQELSAEYVAPRNAVEKKLVEIVSGLLKIDKVGVYDNFFELGGHSLLATQFMSRLRETFGLEIPLRILFEKPVIAEVAAEIELAHRDDGEIRPEPIPMKRASRAEHRINRSELN